MNKLQEKKEWVEQKLAENQRNYDEAQKTLQHLKDESNALHIMRCEVNAELAKVTPAKTGAIIIDGTTIMTATHTDISEGE